jgi:hypothetical protein
MGEPRRELYTAHIPEHILSRGTGEEIPLGEVTTFDVMPQLIGSTFLTTDELGQRVHLHGDHYGPFLAQENAYTRLAELELLEPASGGLIRAIDAYRRGLHRAIKWLGAVAALGSPDHSLVLLTKDDIDRMDLSGRFGNLEDQLASQIWDGEVAFHPDRYTDFVREVRRLEKRRFQLHQLFFFGFSEACESVEADGQHNLEVGREYMDTCVAMHRFKEAARVAKELGLTEEEAKLLERARDEPRDNPRLASLLELELAKFDRD